MARGELPWEQGGGVKLTVAEEILAKYAAVSWTVYFVGLSRDVNDFTLVGGKASAWLDWSGLGNDATQATDANRPTYSATAINSLPGMTLDGGDWLATGNIDASADSALAMHCLYQDTDAGIRYQGEFGQLNAGQTGMTLRVNNPASTIEAVGFNAGQPGATSAATYPMTSPGVVSGTWDSALAASEMTVWHDGVDVTSTRADVNTAGAVVTAQPLVIGARFNGSSAMAGAMGGFVLAGGAGSGAAVLAAHAAVADLLVASKGL